MPRHTVTRDAMNHLLARAQAGEQDALAAAVAANDGLINRIARRYLNLCTSHDMDDLRQYGRIGLCKAIRDYDPSRSARWSTVAGVYITNEIRRNLQHDMAIRIPCHYLDKARQNPALTYPAVVSSLDAPACGDEANSPWLDLTPGEHHTQAEAFRRLEQDDARKVAEHLLARLTPAQQRVVRLRYGLDGAGPRTLAQVAHILGITRQRVQQVEAISIAAMRQRGAPCDSE